MYALCPGTHTEGVFALSNAQIIGQRVVLSDAANGVDSVCRRDRGRRNRSRSASDDDGTGITARKKYQVRRERHCGILHLRGVRAREPHDRRVDDPGGDDTRLGHAQRLVAY